MCVQSPWLHESYSWARVSLPSPGGGGKQQKVHSSPRLPLLPVAFVSNPSALFTCASPSSTLVPLAVCRRLCHRFDK